MSIRTVKIGIAKLDEMLGGGLRPGSTTVLWACPGISNSPFAYQLLARELVNHGSGICLAQSKSVDAIIKEMGQCGWDVGRYRKKSGLRFIDAYSSLTSTPSSKSDFVIQDPKSIAEITETIETALRKCAKNQKEPIIVIDSLSTLIDHCGEQSIDEILKWKKLFKEYNAVAIFLFTEWVYNDKILGKIKSLADAIIKLGAIEEKVILREYLTVPKISWADATGKSVPFKIIQPGGVRIFIPKILVTGPFNAGKSSFVHSASTRAVSVDRIGTTVALDHGHVDYAGFEVDLFGTPGQERFDPIIELLGGESIGVIVVVDATNPQGFPRAKNMLEKSKTAGLPYVVVANKANLKGALKLADIRKKMGLPDNVPILPVVAEDLSKVSKTEKRPCKLRQADVHAALQALFDRIM